MNKSFYHLWMAMCLVGETTFLRSKLTSWLPQIWSWPQNVKEVIYGPLLVMVLVVLVIMICNFLFQIWILVYCEDEYVGKTIGKIEVLMRHALNTFVLSPELNCWIRDDVNSNFHNITMKEEYIILKGHLLQGEIIKPIIQLWALS